MKAIDTVYKGYKFRSRLEARWAVFFDTLGIPWDYEREGYDLDGTFYLPDFWLPEQDCWIEIKGQKPTKEENDKAGKLAEASGKNVYIFFNIPPDDIYDMDMAEEAGHVFIGDEGWDLGQMWCECPKCHKFGIEFEGRAARLCGCFPDSDRGHNYDSPRLIKAYTAARQARFER